MNISLDVTSQFMEQFEQSIKESVAQAVKNLAIEERIMTKKEVAQFFKVSIPTLESFMREGLPYFQHGQVIRFLFSEVVAWSKNNEKGG